MKLIIQIPCYNEEETLAVALSELPREIQGIDKVEWLIIDDGSTDKTVEVARESGVEHVIRHTTNQGLAKGFMTGLDACLRYGADIIVNTDADNQYNAKDIPALIKPILDNKADIVIGERPISTIEHFSPIKKLLQKLGSWVVRVASKTNIPDAPSGFRAMSREAALKLNVFSEYTYTLETIIQAGQKNMAIVSIPVGVNEDLRPSKLVRSISSYVRRSILTIFRIFMTYRPFRFFAIPGFVLSFMGIIGVFRFIYFYMTGDGGGHIQSVVLSTGLLSLGILLVLTGMLADLISVNRKLMEKTLEKVRRIELQLTEKDKAQ